MIRPTLIGVVAGVIFTFASLQVNADVPTSNPFRHPIRSYHQHQIQADTREADRYAERKMVATEQFTAAQQDFQNCLRLYGATSDKTRKAETRMKLRQREISNYGDRRIKATEKLQRDVEKLHHDIYKSS